MNDDAGRRAARGADLLQRDQPRGAAHPAEGGRDENSRLPTPNVPTTSSACVRLVGRCGVGVLGVVAVRERSERAAARLAVRAAAAAAAGARGEVPAVRDPHAAQRHAGHHRAAPRAAGGEHAPAGARRRGAGSGQARRGVASLAAALLDQGTTTRSAAADRRPDRLHRRRARHRLGRRPHLRQRRRDEGLVRRSAMDLLADVVRNPAFAPEEIERQKQQAISSLQVNANDPDYVASVAVRPAGLRLPSLRPAGQRHARDAGGDHARRTCRRSTASTSCRTT